MNEHWIRENIKFTSYTKTENDIIRLHNSNDLTEEFLLYSNNYFKASKLIVLHLINEGSNTRNIAILDTWFFSLTYLYRQSLELMLKAVLLNFDVLQNDVIKKMRHDLGIGLGMLNDCVDENIKDNPNYIWLQQYLNNISELDRESDMFRYPFDNNMQIFFKEQKHYSYIKIYENVDRARNTLLSLINSSLESYTTTYDNMPFLLIEGGHYYQQAVIGYRYSHRDFYPYIKAYTECANYLLNLMNSSKDYSDLFLPMCYLFRNSIELELKRIYILHSHLNDSSYNLLKYKHKLLKLWKITYPTIDEHSGASKNDKTLEHCSKYIKQLNDWDGTSSKFRYPIDKSGNYFFKRELRYNFNNVGQCFNDINYFFSCVEMQLDNHLDYKLEMEAENSSYL